MHAYDPLTPIEETLRFLDDAVRAGKIRYVGLSNFTGWQLQKAVDVADFRGLARPVDPAAAVQPAGPRDRVGDRAGLSSPKGSGCSPGRRSAAAG